MTLRGLLRELKDFPATMTFCLLWIVVFAAMVGTQMRRGDHIPRGPGCSCSALATATGLVT